MIQIRDLHKSYGENEVLKGVNIDIMDGEILTIIGGSGEGKTVLLKCMIGLIRPDRGEIIIDGTDITKLGERGLAQVQKKFGMLFQASALFDSMTVAENVAFGLHNLTKLPGEQKKKVVTEKLNMVGLEAVEHLKPEELSGGMKKRVALARAIAMGPKYILYDEPTTGLDPIMADVINELIIYLQKTLEITSVAVTHDMVSAYKISNRLAMLYDGKIEGVGTPDEIKHTENQVIRQFVSGSGKGPIKTGVLKIRRQAERKGI